MSDKEKILKTLSSLIETGILTANDVKKELVTNFKFKKETKILLKPEKADDLLEVIKIILKAEQEPEKTLVFFKKLIAFSSISLVPPFETITGSKIIFLIFNFFNASKTSFIIGLECNMPIFTASGLISVAE